MNVRERITKILGTNKFVFLHASRQVGVTVNSLIQLSKENAENKYFVCNRNSKRYVKQLIKQYCDEDTVITVLSYDQYKGTKITENDIVVFDNILFDLNEQMDGSDVINLLDSVAKKIWIVETGGIRFNVLTTILEIFNNSKKFSYFGLVKEDENQKSILGSKYTYEYMLDYFAWLGKRNEITQKYINLRYKTDELRIVSISNTEQDFIEINLMSSVGITTSGYAHIPENATVTYGIDFASSKEYGSVADFNTSGYIQLNGGLLTGNTELKANGVTSSGTITTKLSDGSNISTDGAWIVSSGNSTVWNCHNQLTNSHEWWNQPYWQDYTLTNPWYKAYQSSPVIRDKHSISIDLELTKEQYYELTSEMIKENISFSEFITKKIFDKKY